MVYLISCFGFITYPSYNNETIYDRVVRLYVCICKKKKIQKTAIDGLL